MRNTNDGLGVIAAFATNESVAARLPKAVLGEEGVPIQPVEFGYRAFHAVGCHIAQSHVGTSESQSRQDTQRTTMS